MDYWESGMHLRLGTDIFDSFRRYQARLIREYDRMAREFSFVTVDARRTVEEIQSDLRSHIGRYLSGEVAPAPRRRAARTREPVRRATPGARKRGGTARTRSRRRTPPG
jgi:hypothetical protein